MSGKSNKTPEFSSAIDADGNHIYLGDVHLDDTNSLGHITKLINKKTNILELGPATGYFTKYLTWIKVSNGAEGDTEDRPDLEGAKIESGGDLGNGPSTAMNQPQRRTLLVR